MAAPAPKPNKVGRTPLAFDWTSLPSEGRKGPAPKLPDLRKWRKATREAWAAWWASPQAVAWDQTGKTMWRWAILYDQIVADEVNVTAASAEMRQLEDRHGMNPAALLRLRWRIVADEVADRRDTRPVGSSAKARLRAVGGGP